MTITKDGVELVKGESYAIVLRGTLTNFHPLEGHWSGHSMCFVDPDDPEARPQIVAEGMYRVHGGWDEPVTEGGKTYRQTAAHMHGQLLRQRDLAHRLSDFGIPRKPEPYIKRRNEAPNAVETSMVLNYDELDRLLRAAGF